MGRDKKIDRKHRMNTYVEAKFDFQGIHCWPEAPSEVGFLASPHRHVFKVVARKKVDHSNRDVEFICLKNDMLACVSEEFEKTGDVYDLGFRSCEDLARLFAERFGLSSCWVYEDGENGGGVEL